MRKKLFKNLQKSWLLVVMFLFSITSWGQVALSEGGNYTETFDGIGSGLPTGWAVYNGVSATANGTSQSVTTTKTAWGDSSNAFKNFASADNLTSGASSTIQSNSTDRVIGVKQGTSGSAIPVAFECTLENTSGFQNFNLTFKLQSLVAANPRIATWYVQYKIGTGNWITITTSPESLTTGNKFSNDNISVDFGSLLDDKNSNVKIRVYTITAAGSGNGAVSAIDDFVLTYETASSTQVATPTFSFSGTPVATDTYSNSTNATLATTTSGATIYYTTDGSDPTTSSTVYSAPFTVSATTTIKAFATASGLDNSAIVTKTVTIVYPPANDLCSGAVELFTNAVATNGTLLNATITSPFSVDISDVWYKITPTFNETYTITTTGFSGDVDVYLYSQSNACPTSATYISRAWTTSNPEVVSTALSAGVTYFIRVVAADAAAQNSFNIRVTATVPVPTITAGAPAVMTAVVGGTSATQNISVGGTNLEGNISVALTGSSYFSVSPNSFTTSGGNLIVTYTPTVAGSHSATVTLSSDNATNVVLTLNGTATLATPLAISATAVACDGFTANWNAVAGAESYSLDVYTKTNSSSSAEAFNNHAVLSGWTTTNVTEETAGGGYLKMVSSSSSLISPAVDLTNFTSKKLNFRARSFGSTSNAQKTITVSISVNDGQTWQPLGTRIPDDGTLRDMAEFNLDGYTGTQVKIRIQTLGASGSVGAGVADLILSGIQNIESRNYILGSPFNAITNTSYQVTNLDSETTYHYVVRATSNAVTSSNSNEITQATTEAQLFYVDADGDGYGSNSIAPISACSNPNPELYVSIGGDCNDNNILVNPGATEVCWNGIDDNCDGVQSEGCSPVVVNMATLNNSVLASFSTGVSAHGYTFAGSTSATYRFMITNLQTGASEEVYSPTRFVTIPTTLRNYNVSYTVTAAAVINGENVPYAGNTITVFSPTISLVKLAPTSCGVLLGSLTSTLTSTVGMNAISYTFRARLSSDNGPTPTYYYVTSANRNTTMSSFVGLIPQYSSSYTIDVQYEFLDVISGSPVQSGYGEACVVTTPGLPLVRLSSPTCGTRVSSMNATVSSNVASHALEYQFRMRLTSDNGSTPTYYYTLPNSSRFSTLGSFQGVSLSYNSSYSISVQYKVLNNGLEVWSGYGQECNLETPLFPVTEITPSLCGLSSTSLDQTLTIVPYPGFPTYRVTLFEQVGESLVPVGSITRTVSNFKLNMFTGATTDKTYSVSVSIQLGGVFGPDGKGCDISTYPASVMRTAVQPLSVVSYPNPFTNGFNLELTTSDKNSSVGVMIYDMLGRQVEQRQLSSMEANEFVFGTELPTGVYNVVVTQAEETRTVRVIKR